MVLKKQFFVFFRLAVFKTGFTIHSKNKVSFAPNMASADLSLALKAMLCLIELIRIIATTITNRNVENVSLKKCRKASVSLHQKGGS